MPRLRSCVRVLMVLGAAALGACASGPEPPPPMTFDLKADPQANAGRLFYFLARTVNEKQFMLEGYQDVAAKAFADPQDPSVLGVFSVVPGTKREYKVTQPAQGTVALYFFLTQPGQQWKRLLSVPLDDEYDIEVKADNQVRVSGD